MKISVCSPSYKRGDEPVKTASYLPFVKVYVSPEEFEQYKKSNPNLNIVACDSGVQGNVSRVRNHILKREFEAGADVVVMVDDDLKGIYYWEDNKSYLVETEKFLEFVEKYSIVASEFGAYYWGMNVNKDKQVYKETQPFSTLSFVGGPFSAFLKGNECRYDERLLLKEDYDMTIQQLAKYRVVFRINKFFYDAKQNSNKGGCAVQRNYQKEEEQLNLLQKKWGKKIVRWDNRKAHNAMKEKKVIDFNPIVNVPIKGI